jgi:spore coat protein U-like protein
MMFESSREARRASTAHCYTPAMKGVPLTISALLLASLTSASLAWSTPGVSAQQASTDMLANATVLRKCVVTTSPMNFGEYDPVSANARVPLDGQAVITVACTKGTVVNIGIDDGANASGAMRRMIFGTTYLPYELFQDLNRTMRWGNTATDGLDGGMPIARSATVHPLLTRAGCAGRSEAPSRTRSSSPSTETSCCLSALRALSPRSRSPYTHHDRRDQTTFSIDPLMIELDANAQRGDDDHEYLREGAAV